MLNAGAVQKSTSCVVCFIIIGRDRISARYTFAWGAAVHKRALIRAHVVRKPHVLCAPTSGLRALVLEHSRAAAKSAADAATGAARSLACSSSGGGGAFNWRHSTKAHVVGARARKTAAHASAPPQSCARPAAQPGLRLPLTAGLRNPTRAAAQSAAAKAVRAIAAAAAEAAARSLQPQRACE